MKKCKKYMGVCLMGAIFVMAAVLAAPDQVSAKTKTVITENGTKIVCDTIYTGKTYGVVDIKNAKEEVVIPETVDGKHKITGVFLALEPAYGKVYKKVRHIYLPSTVDTISEEDSDEEGCCYNAFSAFPNLKEITIDCKNKNYSAAGGVVYDKKKRLVAIAPGITEAKIESQVTSILPNALSNLTNLERFTVQEGNTKYKSEDGVLYSKDGKKLICYPVAKKETVFYVPKGVETIEETACFKQKNITQVVMSSSVRRIKSYAFAWCPLKKVKLNKKLQVIEEGAFRNEKWCSLSLPSGLKKAEIGSLPVKKLVIPKGCKVTLDVDQHSSETSLRAKTLVVKDKTLNLLKLDKEYNETLWENEYFEEDTRPKSAYAKKTIYAYKDSKAYKQIIKIAKKYHMKLKKL